MTYDYVIVGGRLRRRGAGRAALGERRGVSVLLLEAGPDYRSADAPLAMRIANPFGIIEGRSTRRLPLTTT